MAKIQTELLQILVVEEIDRIVAHAARGRGFIRAGAHAYALAKQFPNCGLSGTDLVNEIVQAASKAGVAVEIYQPMDRAA